MDNVYVYFAKLPPQVNEIVTPCLSGYTIWIDITLDEAHRLKAYEHALWHIKNHDFEKDDVQQIEWDAHQRKDK